HHYTHLNPHIAWMTPLGNAIILAIPGLIFALGLWFWPTNTSLRIALFLISFLTFLSALFRVNRWYITTTIPLAVVLALTTTFLVSAQQRRFYKLVRVTLGLLVATVLALAIGVYGWQALAEQRALAKLPPAPKGAPNVLLIVMDAVGAEHLSLYGYTRPTSPQLEKFARGGVSFERAIATAPWTLPSHASMFTGRYPHELTAGWVSALDDRYPTLAEVLQNEGSLTAGFVANTFYCDRETGLDQGFIHYEDHTVSAGQVVMS